MKLLPTEVMRLKHINFLMNELYDDLDNIYEALTDREFDELRTHIRNIVTKLEEIYDNNEID